jgi:hypothetical protein
MEVVSRQAATQLLEALEASARRLEAIEADYRAARSPGRPSPAPFEIGPYPDECIGVLRAALGPGRRHR